MKEALLAAARALDGGNLDESRNHLRSLPLVRGDRPERLVAVALWKRLLGNSRSDDPPTAGNDPQTLAALDNMAAAALNRVHVWNAYEAIPVLEARIGPVDTAAMVASTIWDCVLKSNPAMFALVFELFFRAGGERCAIALEQFLAEQENYIPSYWHFVLFTRSSPGRSHFEFAALAAQLLKDTRRSELAPLFDVYLKQMRQAPAFEIAAAARALSSAGERMLVAEYMTGMGYTPDELQVVVAAMPFLAGDSNAGQAIISLMQARLGTAEHRWKDALEFAGLAGADQRFRHAANLLRALALARLKKSQEAEALLDDVLASADAAPFHRARATFIKVTNELAKRDLPLPEEQPVGIFTASVGRPLAQSLWVGPKLRWIERLCIKSYLDNGWRFQLYVYDEPDGVPEGCEVLDASAIIPAKDVFLEGQGSGAHAGSVGAFSDLFRYRLLCKRGGMWTDTDVINFKKFDPDGQRFISTELTDAGLITLNGAIMAAPAGDEMVTRAYERARAILSSNDKMFFTRIGPYLLAEVALEFGVDKIELMPPRFLSPVSWMNTASLLQPFDVVMARQEFRQAVNIHVYTEMWRTLGLGLDRPPGAETFLGRLYADHFGEQSSTETESAQKAINA
jgi:hypothetical protein